MVKVPLPVIVSGQRPNRKPTDKFADVAEKLFRLSRPSFDVAEIQSRVRAHPGRRKRRQRKPAGFQNDGWNLQGLTH